MSTSRDRSSLVPTDSFRGYLLHIFTLITPRLVLVGSLPSALVLSAHFPSDSCFCLSNPPSSFPSPRSCHIIFLLPFVLFTGVISGVWTKGAFQHYSHTNTRWPLVLELKGRIWGCMHGASHPSRYRLAPLPEDIHPIKQNISLRISPLHETLAFALR